MKFFGMWYFHVADMKTTIEYNLQIKNIILSSYQIILFQNEWKSCLRFLRT